MNTNWIRQHDVLALTLQCMHALLLLLEDTVRFSNASTCFEDVGHITIHQEANV